MLLASEMLAVVVILATANVVVSTLRYHIREEVGPGPTFVGDVLTDSGVSAILSRDDLRFAVLPGRHQRLFRVDEETGILRTRSPLDRDTLCVDKLRLPCVLDVEVAVVRPAESFRAFSVEVVVDDVNDNEPRFDRESVVIRVLESAVPQLSVYALPAATDADSPAFGVVRYELTPNDTFAVELAKRHGEESAPTMTLLRRLDREVESRYDLVLKAVDGGRPSLSGTLSVHVVVVDTNDNAPTFEQSVYNVTVLETMKPVRPLVRVHAVDDDDGSNGAVSYRLGAATTKQHGDLFAVDNITGDILLTRRLDADYSDLYELVVVAFDHGAEQRTSTVRVNVHVDDVNGHPPTISINALDPDSGDEGRRTAEVRENQPPGTFVAYVSSQDADRGVNGQVDCSVASANFTLERVHTRLYKLATAVRFDREEADRYVAVVRCTDLGQPPLATTDWAEVTVLDDNDHAPRFVQPTFRAAVTETAPVGRSLLTVSAVDLDAGPNADVRYHLAERTEKVRMDSETGTIFLSEELDYETEAEQTFDVVAVDRGTPPRSSTAAVRIAVINQNDCAPRFKESTFSFGVFEGLPPSTDVGTVSAVDDDAPPYNDFYFLLQTRSGASSAKSVSEGPSFAIDQRTGLITTTKTLDREQTPVYDLIALAIDSRNASMSASANVTIYVADKNDNKPVIVFPSASNYTVQVSSYSPVGYIVGKIQAYDADIGTNAQLVYSMTSHDDVTSPPFDVDSSNGAVYVTSSLRRDGGGGASRAARAARRDYVLSVTVRDAGSPSLSAGASLVVHVNDSRSFAVALSLLRTSDGSTAGQFGFNQQILVVLAAVTSIVAMLLVAAIVFVRRRHLAGRRKPLPAVTWVGPSTAGDITKTVNSNSEVVKTTHQQQQQSIKRPAAAGTSATLPLIRVNDLLSRQTSATPTRLEMGRVGGTANTLPAAGGHCVCPHCINISTSTPIDSAFYASRPPADSSTQEAETALTMNVPADNQSVASTEDHSLADSGHGLSEDSEHHYRLALSTFRPRWKQHHQLPPSVRSSTSRPRVLSTPGASDDTGVFIVQVAERRAAAAAASVDGSVGHWSTVPSSYGHNLASGSVSTDKLSSYKSWQPKATSATDSNAAESPSTTRLKRLTAAAAAVPLLRTTGRGVERTQKKNNGEPDLSNVSAANNRAAMAASLPPVPPGNGDGRRPTRTPPSPRANAVAQRRAAAAAAAAMASAEQNLSPVASSTDANVSDLDSSTSGSMLMLGPHGASRLACVSEL